MAGYDKNFGHIAGAPQAPPSWGCVPTSMVSTGVPSSGSPYGSYPQTDPSSVYSEEFTEYKDPKKEAEDELKRMKKKERRKARKTSDSHQTAQMLMACGLVACIFWTVPMFGTGWHKKMYYGFGIDMVTIRTGLFAISVNVDCHVMKMPFGISDSMMHKFDVEQQICHVFESMNGTHNMNKAKDLACVMGHNACNIMSTIFYSGFFLFFSFFCSALMDLCAFLFMYYYWHIEHLKVIRNWAMGLYAMAPAFGLIGFLMYAVLSPDIGDLPRSWSQFVETFNQGTGLFTIKPIEGQDSIIHSMGWCFWFSFISCATSMTAPIMWGIWFIKHPDEKEHELASTLEQEEVEQAIEAVYQREDEVRNNTAEYGAAMATGMYPQPQGAYPQPGVGGYPGAAGYGGGYGAAAYGGAGGAYGYGGGQAAPGYPPAAGYPQGYTGY